ncbi:MAG: hypothetical protein J1F36_03725 [Clostridiales bacterium]|nr:hypothetical protein [Clostridiales bacterium]
MPKSQSKPKNTGNVIKPLIVLVVALIIVTIFIILALLLAPRAAIPEFKITDRQGSWEAQGEIAVFDDKIMPSSKGEYYFILKNDSEASLRYGINLKEYLFGVNYNAQSFMQYRLKMNGVNLADDDGAWHYIDDIDYYNIIILPGTEQLMTLEWRWPFEIDGTHDQNDTVVGRTGGKLSVVFFVWAEVIVK